VKRLYAAFAKLRRLRGWSRRVAGGIAFFEVTLNPDTKRWHPHLHLLLECDYLQIDLLKALWLRCTGDSWVCDVKRVRTFDEVTSYVVKYASKGFDPTVWRSEPHLREAIEALSNLKTVFAFGNHTKFRLLSRPHDQAAWLPIARASDLIRDALAGDAIAHEICLKLWGRRYTNWLERSYRCPDTS